MSRVLSQQVLFYTFIILKGIQQFKTRILYYFCSSNSLSSPGITEIATHCDWNLKIPRRQFTGEPLNSFLLAVFLIFLYSTLLFTGWILQIARHSTKISRESRKAARRTFHWLLRCQVYLTKRCHFYYYYYYYCHFKNCNSFSFWVLSQLFF